VSSSELYLKLEIVIAVVWSMTKFIYTEAKGAMKCFLMTCTV